MIGRARKFPELVSIQGVLVLSLLTAAFSGCATMTVSSDFSPTTEFSVFETYDWGPPDALPTGDARLDNNPFFHSRVRAAVEAQLAARGFNRDTTGQADLLIHYHATVRTRQGVINVDSEYGYGDDTGVFEYQEGTLLLDIADARTKRVVWRGWAQANIEGVIDNRTRMEERIQEAARRILERFPPK